ncbi:MAG: hypothetical protein NVSMB32_12000 [Actinomycetota bacterium]
MGVKYLSEDWAKEVTSLLQSTDAVTKTVTGQSFGIQQVVTDVPERGEVRFYAKVADGVPEVVIGEVANPDATLTATYDISILMDKGELNPQAAFMQGKLKIQGNLMKLMGLQGFVSSLGPAVAGLQRDY